MARSLVPRGRIARGPKRKTLWIDFANIATTETPLAAGAALLFGSLNAAALAFRPFTVVRTRAICGMATDQVAATEFPFGALGFAVVSDTASAIGVTAVPTPITDASSSLFFVWQAMMTNLQLSSAIAYTPTWTNWDIDSKAMRKVEVGEDVVITVENGSSTDGLQFNMIGRMLIKTN